MSDSIFIDTGFVIALINDKDRYHQKAEQLAIEFSGYPSVTTDAVLLEIGNALSRIARQQANEIIGFFQESKEVDIVHLNPALFDKGLQLYRLYQDKTWGLVDCISFVVMREMAITDALTFDHHFEQAGFKILS